MRRIVYFLIAFTLVAKVAAQSQNRDPFITKSFPGETIREVYSRTSGGSITVEGGSDQARVEVFVKGNNGKNLSEDEITERIREDYELVIEVTGNKLTVTAEPRNKHFNWRDALNMSFRIYVPQNVSTDLTTSGGGIDLRDLSGTQNFSTSGGGLRLDRLSGTIKGRTSGGGIDVSNTRDQVDLNTSGGSINAVNCSGTLNLSTSGGSIKLDNLDGNIRANTSGGPIHGRAIKGELNAHTSGGGVDLQDMKCSLEASTSGGKIKIEIAELQQYVTARNSGGNIDITLPGNKGLDLKLRGDRINFENLNNFSGDKKEHKVEGKVNGGGVPVTLQTSGTVTVAMH